MLISLNLLILIVLPCYFDYVDGIGCYVCNSKEDAKCIDPFNVSMPLQECTQGMETDGTGEKAVDVIEIIMQNLDSKGTEQRTDFAISTDPVHIDTVCQKIIVSVGDETITSRGCSPMLVDRMHPCDAVKLSTRETMIQLRHCLTCAYAGCNVAMATNKPSPIVSAVLCLFTLLLFHIKVF